MSLKTDNSYASEDRSLIESLRCKLHRAESLLASTLSELECTKAKLREVTGAPADEESSNRPPARSSSLGDLNSHTSEEQFSLPASTEESNQEYGSGSTSIQDGERMISIDTSEGPVPGIIVASKNVLEFGQRLIRIRPEEFVGIRPIETKDEVEKRGNTKSLVASSSWPGTQSWPTAQAKLPERASEAASAGAWEIVWKEGGGQGPLKRVTFEADRAGYAYVQDALKAWAQAPIRSPPATQRDVSARQPPAGPTLTRNSSVGPQYFNEAAGGASEAPTVSSPSRLLSTLHFTALASWVPIRYRRSTWTLLYSTMRDGVSMHTMYRMCSGQAPCVLVIRDSKGHVFGGYASDAWKMSPRYYGTGECFMFQAAPTLVKYPWSRESNDYFQFASVDSIAMGGGGHFSLWIDADLQFGNSGDCQTFGSPCLASSEQFEVAGVELWGLH